MKKIIFAGTIKDKPNCGESIKNDLFIKRFNEVYDRVYTIELSKLKERPVCLLKLIWLAIIYSQTPIVISLRSHVADFIIKIMTRLHLSKNIYFWVVGGSFHVSVEKGVYNPEKYKKIKMLLVQSPAMVDSLKKSGIQNVVFVPNSKRIDYIPEINCRKYDKIRFVFLSRIHPDKGCDMILNCVNRLNLIELVDKFEVDFYGPMFYENPMSFIDRIDGIPNARYQGFLDLSQKEGYTTLSNYNMMLFPTWWSGEGFPGVIIDAYVAGLPVIASDWNFNSEVVSQDLGFVIPVKNEDALLEVMKEVIIGNVDIRKMSVNCQMRAKTYDNRFVLSEDNLIKLGLL